MQFVLLACGRQLRLNCPFHNGAFNSSSPFKGQSDRQEEEDKTDDPKAASFIHLHIKCGFYHGPSEKEEEEERVSQHPPETGIINYLKEKSQTGCSGSINRFF